MAQGTLLIVDDNESLRSALRAYMSRVAGWHVVLVAPDSGRGLMLAAEHAPTAIVLDNRMPGGDGLEVLPALRQTCPQARIVMHTTDDSEEMRSEAERRGADATVAKGSPLDELAALLRVA
ncbi:MAG: response regulator transcription factor [Frankiales bacterium]|nr:response regulator transcription factor [Frankiales bacterium]